jgi:site-specific DNA-methyltransferase (adenine-specific)
MDLNKVICGDCIEELKKLPENSIDAIITDPPLSKETDAYDTNCYGKYNPTKEPIDYTNSLGRFPANIILDEESAEMLDEQSGELGLSKKGSSNGTIKGMFGLTNCDTGNLGFGDKGGASRFFYVAKASRSERNYGCEELEDKPAGMSMRDDEFTRNNMGNTPAVNREPVKNHHPTVKPIKLIEYLIKLVTPKDGIVLDPFLGSGTTAIACLKQNKRFIGIEKEQEYIKIAEARIKPYLEQQKITGVNNGSN